MSSSTLVDLAAADPLGAVSSSLTSRKVAVGWSLVQHLMSRHRVRSLRFSMNCYFSKRSLLVSAIPLNRSTLDRRTTRACAKCCVDFWSPCRLTKTSSLLESPWAVHWKPPLRTGIHRKERTTRWLASIWPLPLWNRHAGLWYGNDMVNLHTISISSAGMLHLIWELYGFSTNSCPISYSQWTAVMLRTTGWYLVHLLVNILK